MPNVLASKERSHSFAMIASHELPPPVNLKRSICLGRFSLYLMLCSFGTMYVSYDTINLLHVITSCIFTPK
jgi:hypothetical protein